MADLLNNPQIDLLKAATDFANMVKAQTSSILKQNPAVKPLWNTFYGHAENCEIEAYNAENAMSMFGAKHNKQWFDQAQKSLTGFYSELQLSSVVLSQIEDLMPQYEFGGIKKFMSGLVQEAKYLEQKLNFYGSQKVPGTWTPPVQGSRMNEQVLNQLLKLASEFDENGDFALADEVEGLISEAAEKKDKKLDPKAKTRNRGDCVFPANHPKVKDKKDHFPLGSKSQSVNALARASQYSKVPSWYSGSLESLVRAVRAKVRAKFPGIKLTNKSKNPGKG